MKIALDFDGTYTAAPDLWRRFVKMAKEMGHEVTIVTLRHSAGDNSDVAIAARRMGIHWTTTDYLQKSARWTADVWIDDMPEFIPTEKSLGVMVKPHPANGPRCGECAPCRQLAVFRRVAASRQKGAACEIEKEPISGDLKTGAVLDFISVERLEKRLFDVMWVLQEYARHKETCPANEDCQRSCECGVQSAMAKAMASMSGEGIVPTGRWAHSSGNNVGEGE